MTLGFIVISILILGGIGFTEWFSFYVRGKVPAKGKFIEINGSRIHYLEKGSGSPLLLIHGLTGSALNFDCALMDQLAKSFRVIAMDRPGSGYSTRSYSQSADLNSQAEVLVSALRKLDIQDIFVVGHSLGGAVALQMASGFSEFVKGLVLLAPLTQRQQQVPRAFKALLIQPKILCWIYSRTFATPMAFYNRKKTGRMIFYPDRAPKDFGTRGGGFLGAEHCAYFNASCDLISAAISIVNLTQRYSQIQVPVSILFGQDDQVLDPRIHGTPMEAVNSNFKVKYVRGGHMLMASQPVLVHDFIREAFSGELK